MALAALESCFRAVPPDAVAAVVDCVLASSFSSTSPSNLFHSLLDSFPHKVLASRADAVSLSHATALCHLLSHLGDDSKDDALRVLLSRVFLPLLLLKEDDLQLQQVIALMCGAVSANQSWDLLGATILPLCIRSSALAMDSSLPTSTSPQTMYHYYHPDSGEDDEHPSPGLLPLSKASILLALLLRDSLRRTRIVQEGGDASLPVLVNNLTWDISRLVLKMLAYGQEHRSCATRILLQPLLISLADVSCVTVNFGAVQLKLSRSGFLESIWNSCVSLFSLGRAERLDAYGILSLYFSTLKLGHQYAVLRADEVQSFDLRNVTEFWDELRRGLVDKDSLVRKQAFYVLKISLSMFSSGNDGIQQCSGRSPAALTDQAKSNTTASKRERWANKEAKSLGVEEISQSSEHCSSGQDGWKVFLLLYEMLQEFGTHLVEAAWTHQVVLLFESTPQSDHLNHKPFRAFHAQMESFEGIFHWMAVLWERGFTHDNPQVRCLVMQSCLNIEWERYKGYTQMIPREFVLGPLTRGLNDVVHHKDFGVGGVYNSETIKGAERFFSNYAQKLTTRDRLHLVWNLASAAKQDSFGRAGLMTLAYCIASCACQSDTDYLQCASAGKEIAECNGDTSVAVNTADLLDTLWILCERSKQHFNPKYRLKVCEQVIRAAASLISAAEIPLNQLLYFISAIPRECTDHLGPLRVTVQKWFIQKKECSVRNTLFEQLIDFPATFLKHTGVEGSYLYDDEDVGAWEAEARRWARTLLLVTSEEQHFMQIFMFLEKYDNKLSEHCPVRQCVQVKFFIITLSLIEELEAKQKKLFHQNNTITGEGSDRTNGLEHHALNKNLANSLLLILENMVVFIKPLCPVFWLRNTDMDLPCSVKGKLGGPSQRRLATSITSSVLQCIWSMRCISSLVSWCIHYTAGVSLHSAFSFLWEFCWEVIQHCTYGTETGAELHLAAYEALAFVLPALSTVHISQFLDFVEPKKINRGSKFSLDLLVNTFLGNINNLLTNGVLTRSRRAVLMCWKWLCVDSLLSISRCCGANESQLETLGPLFSGSTLRSILLDIIESLENAGENSVVPILRCVRSIFGLLHFNTGHKNLSALGISYEVPPVAPKNVYDTPLVPLFKNISRFGQGMVSNKQHWLSISKMMMQLVKSSWVLHLSCNKRRVAPIAALLSAILHPSIFPNLEMHQTTEKGPGPLKWFVENLLNEGSKSPRTIRLAALHLSGLWLTYPKTLTFYMEELKLLALYGSVAFDEDFEAELSENHEARFEVSMLAQSPDREFTEVFINTELYARVSVAVLFHQLWKQIKEKRRLETDEALKSGKLFLLKLLDSAVNDNDLSKELYKKYSSVHRRKVRVWQMICVLSHYVEDDIVEEVTSSVHICLYRNNLPAVRQYLETFAILNYLKFPTLAPEQLLPIFHDNGMRQQALSSYVFIAANVILHSMELAVQINHLNQLLPPIIPFLTSHHHSLRSFTQLLVHCVLSKLWPILQLESSEDTFIERRCFQDLKKYLAENNDCVRLRVSIEGFLDVFDPNTSGTPSGIFTARSESTGFECVPVSVLERVNDFLNDVREELRHAMVKDSATIKNEDLAVEKDSSSGEKIASSQDGLNFQKKIIPHRDSEQALNSSGAVMGNNDISRLLFEIEEDDEVFNIAVESRKEAGEAVRQSQQEVMVVASLVDRIPNLAGLTRTCEIFRAGGLVVADKSVVQDKQFRLISVTAEKWVPMTEVPVESVRAFLERKKAEGYAVIGLEQTAKSKAMDEFSFPEKTVVVLGREKEGIPVEVIQVLDACVEIPQLGVIRSLNVHVSAAIALWEYTRQQRTRRRQSSYSSSSAAAAAQ